MTFSAFLTYIGPNLRCFPTFFARTSPRVYCRFTFRVLALSSDLSRLSSSILVICDLYVLFSALPNILAIQAPEAHEGCLVWTVGDNIESWRLCFAPCLSFLWFRLQPRSHFHFLKHCHRSAYILSNVFGTNAIAQRM